MINRQNAPRMNAYDNDRPKKLILFIIFFIFLLFEILIPGELGAGKSKMITSYFACFRLNFTGKRSKVQRNTNLNFETFLV